MSSKWDKEYWGVYLQDLDLYYKKDKRNENYIRYELYVRNKIVCADSPDIYHHLASRIVMERYPDKPKPFGTEWNLELMFAYPERMGFGTKLLSYVKKDMGCPMSVCPTSPDAKSFFRKNGMGDDWIIR